MRRQLWGTKNRGDMSWRGAQPGALHAQGEAWLLKQATCCMHRHAACRQRGECACVCVCAHAYTHAHAGEHPVHPPTPQRAHAASSSFSPCMLSRTNSNVWLHPRACVPCRVVHASARRGHPPVQQGSNWFIHLFLSSRLPHDGCGVWSNRYYNACVRYTTAPGLVCRSCAGVWHGLCGQGDPAWVARKEASAVVATHTRQQGPSQLSLQFRSRASSSVCITAAVWLRPQDTCIGV